jgi:hypothetical protein
VKRDFGKKILHLMTENGIKTVKELTDRINDAANQQLVTPILSSESLPAPPINIKG